MNDERTVEPQYQFEVEAWRAQGPVVLGPCTSAAMRIDPRRVLFIAARYKFCAKMLEGKGRVLEVGCGDGFGAGIVRQAVREVHGTDFDPIFVEAARETNRGREGVTFEVRDITSSAPSGVFDAAYSIDVLEHIPTEREGAFMDNVTGVLAPDGVFVVGTPNVTASAYATPESEIGHVNLKDASTLRALLEAYFENVFLFSMNDEVVHTGYAPMAHYLFAMGVGLKQR